MSTTAQLFDDPAAEAFRAEVRDWLAVNRQPEWDDRFDREVSQEQSLAMRRRWDALLCEGGYAGLTWPVEYRGRGVGPIEEFIFYEAAARAKAPDTLNYIGYDLAGPALMAYGTTEQRERYLPRILGAQDVWCEGFSEPDAGSDMAAVSTTAVRDGEGWRINGQKTWTSHAGVADLCYLLVRTDPDRPRRQNLSVLLVDMRQPGVRVRPIRQITDEREFCEVFFTDAYAPAGSLLGTENDGWRLATLAGFRQTRGVKDGLRRYVLIRSAMDTLLHCAGASGRSAPWRLDREVELLRWHVMRSAEMLARGIDKPGGRSVMRLVWSLLWQRIAQEGLTTTCAGHEWFWRQEFLYSRSLTIAGGTTQIQRNVIANNVLKLPR